MREPHEIQRLRRRTKLKPEQGALVSARVGSADFSKAMQSDGYIRMRDGSYAVVARRGGKPRVVTYLAQNMRPKGTDYTKLFRSLPKREGA